MPQDFTQNDFLHFPFNFSNDDNFSKKKEKKFVEMIGFILLVLGTKNLCGTDFLKRNNIFVHNQHCGIYIYLPKHKSKSLN